MNKIDEILNFTDAYRQIPDGCIRASIYVEDVDWLMAQLKNMNNELCYKCGRYENAHLGSCDGCRWQIGKDE